MILVKFDPDLMWYKKEQMKFAEVRLFKNLVTVSIVSFSEARSQDLLRMPDTHKMDFWT